ncbi:MAG TPA: sigma-70 family RNA polymerase sigma factor [Usitatibacter sp.]|nr:sigma-70 family RNA polymerase sigma factor [Usitatibacter sp.]
MSERPVTDPRLSDLESQRPYLMRYAMAQLRDPLLAEEAVQEALLAAVEGLASFRGHSTLRTWLTSILRFKIADQQRRVVQDRARMETGDADSYDDEAWLDALFDETGHWRDPPQAWANPEAALEQRRFWEAFERCLERLPARGGRVFFKREVMGEDTDDICRAEGISASNCWVILHRARLGLRSCLELHWFGTGSADGA